MKDNRRVVFSKSQGSRAKELKTLHLGPVTPQSKGSRRGSLELQFLGGSSSVSHIGYRGYSRPEPSTYMHQQHNNQADWPSDCTGFRIASEQASVNMVAGTSQGWDYGSRSRGANPVLAQVG